MSSTVHLSYRSDGVAVITFDQPNSRANILTRAMWDEFHTTVRVLQARPGVRGLVIASAKSDIFIAGADLKLLASLSGPNSSIVRELIEFGSVTLGLLEDLPFPTCAAINGAAVGGGLELTMACDFRLCGPNPKVELGLPEVKLGLIPGWGGTQRLTRLCDIPTAANMLLTGITLSTEQAVRAHLADRHVESDDLIGVAAEWVLSHNPEPVRRAKREPLPMIDRELLREAILAASVPQTDAVRELSNVVSRGGEQSLTDALAIETEAFLRLAGSDESKRLIGDFFASRKKS